MNAVRDPLPGVSVIIAAYRATGTVGEAVKSALAEPEVAEVIVIDDCSPDDTAGAASAADDGSGRLKVVRQPENRGPARARNRGFEMAEAEYVAILDSDDRFLPGRFARLFETDGWDVAADNIAFVKAETDPALLALNATSGAGRWLDISEFVQENISRIGRRRGELGFLKPVFRRQFLLENKLRYDARLRLGEDFALYVRALICGARFWITSGCGYVALERADSLSGHHRTEDLAALLGSDAELMNRLDPQSTAFAALRDHRDHIFRRYFYREFLDKRRRVGVARALRAHAARPREMVLILKSYAVDKALHAYRRRRSAAGQAVPVRYLMEG